MSTSCSCFRRSDLDALKTQFEEEGYCLARQVFAGEEIDGVREHFQDMHDRSVPGFYEPLSLEEAGDDILKAYPRVMHPHRFCPKSKGWMLDKRLAEILRVLIGEEPLAVQSMYYFKPPGARGQALHQDQFYLRVQPGTCIAAWTALDFCDEKNGCMMVVPKTADLPIECGKRGSSYDANASGIGVPAGMKVVPAIMEPGDTLLFNGSVIHGSGPNRSKDRWRRSFICHYATGDCESIAEGYLPLHTMEGKALYREATKADQGPCGGLEGNEALPIH